MSEKKPKKVLMISYSFPPAGGSRVQRPLKFAKYLPQFGWQPYVIAADERSGAEDLSLVDEIPDGLFVQRVFSPYPMSLGAALSGARDRGMNKALYVALKAVLKAFSIIYYRTVTVDWYEGWVPFGLRAAEKVISREDIDVIYVHGQPPSSFLIGNLLKKRTGRPIVIDYDDPWTTSVYAVRDKSRRAIRSREIEGEVLSGADAVLSVKPDTIKEIKAAFPAVDAGKLHFLPNGYDPEDYAGLERKRSGKFTVTYIGRLSERYCYSPESFLLAIGALIAEGKIPKSDVEVNFAGTISPAYSPRLDKLIKDLGLGEVVKKRGFLGHKECMKLLLSSDLLLLLMESLEGREESRMFVGSIPAKLFEYLPTGVPILGIVPPGFEADLIRDTGTGFTAEPNDPSSIKKVLGGIYEKFKAGSLGTSPVQAEIEKYDRKALTGKLAEAMDALLERGREAKS